MQQTPNYNLPQFEGTDFFNKEALNDAFIKIDTGISDLQETIHNTSGGAIAITQEVINARKGKTSLEEKIGDIDTNVESLKNKSLELQGELEKHNSQLEQMIDEIDVVTKKYNDIKSKLIANVKDFGAKGDGVTDDTQAIQLAIDSISYGTIFFPKGKYIVSSQITINKGGIYLEGELNGNTDTNSSTIFTKSTNNSPIIKVGIDNDRVYGGGLKNINIFGKIYEHNTLDQIKERPINRQGLYLKQLSFFNIENVTIYGFAQQGVFFDGCYDSTINNLEVCWCGGLSHYSVEITKTNQYVDNSNCLKFINCKFEFSPKLMKFDICRNINFTNCKFESGTSFEFDTISPCVLSTFETGEVNFENCILSVNDDRYYMFEVNNMLFTINNSQFSNGNINGLSKGSKWVNCTNGSIIFTNNTVCCCSNIDYSFIFANGSRIIGNTFISWCNNLQQVIKLNWNNILSDNNFIEKGTPIGGYYVGINGNGNIIENNIENGTIYNIVDLTTYKDNKVIRALSKKAKQYDKDEVNVLGYEFIEFTNTTDINITNFYNGYNGQEIVCITNVNPTRTTIKNNSNIVTGTGADIGLQTSIPIRFIHLNGIWYKIK